MHAPSGIVSTGWPSVEAKCVDLGISFRWWQGQIGRLILAKRADGTYASTVGGTGLSIPRQVGKTFLVAAIMFALCLLRPGFTVLWTAHRLKTAEETFGKLQVFARRKKITPHVRQVFTGSGEQAIVFHNGSRILFGARERGFGRGFDEVDALVFDEAQHMTDSSLDDMVPATNQSRQVEGALMLFMGTPPRPQDPGEVFSRMRADAEAGDEDTGWVEFGAEPDYVPTPLPAPLDDADWGQIAAANPSFPEDTSRTAILRLRKKLGDDSFLREGCGTWNVARRSGALDLATWRDLVDPAEPDGGVTIAVSADPELEYAAVAVGFRRPDGLPHVALVAWAAGTAWVAAEVAKQRRRLGGRVLVDVPLRGLVKGEEVTPSQVAQAHNLLAELVQDRAVRHDGDAPLNVAVEASRWRPVGDTRVLVRRGSTDVTPLLAAALAVHRPVQQLQPVAIPAAPDTSGLSGMTF